MNLRFIFPGGKDDEAQALLRELGTARAETGGTAGEWQLVARTVAEPALAAVEEMICKEGRILLPMALQNLEVTQDLTRERALQARHEGPCPGARLVAPQVASCHA